MKKSATGSKITELKNQILGMKKILREVQKVGHIGHWEFDFETGKTVWSEESYRILGISARGFDSSLSSFLSSVHPEDLDRVKKIVEASLVSLSSYSFFCRIVTPAGKVRHIFGEGIFEFDSDNKIKRLYGIIHEISELKKIQNEKCLSEILGQENERERLSKELHDGLGQILTGISLQLKNLEVSYREKDKVLSRQISKMTTAVVDAVKEVRTISHNISPHMLKKYGLVVSLENICRSAGPVKIAFKTDISRPLDGHIEIMLFRIAQELVTNIIKHSKASHAAIKLTNGRNITLTVEDNGVGMGKSIADNKTSGIGLISIKNRVEIINGNLKITSKKDQGTKIEITVPI
ncbi:MAG: ATP-binding protein [Bacteroidia bacterium]